MHRVLKGIGEGGKKVGSMFLDISGFPVEGIILGAALGLALLFASERGVRPPL